MRRFLLSAFAASALFATIAYAQPTTQPATPSGTVAKKGSVKAAPSLRSAGSIECSKRADAKGLHGKSRRTFRAQCKREMSAKS